MVWQYSMHSIFVHRCFCNFFQPTHDLPSSRAPAATKVRKTISSRVHEAVKAIALVHNVTPVYEANGVTDQAEAEQHYEDTCRVYQASSPDEVWWAGAQNYVWSSSFNDSSFDPKVVC